MAKPIEKRIKTTLYLPDTLWKSTKIKAIELDCDATDIVVRALEKFLKGGK